MSSRKLIYGRYGQRGDFLLLDQDESRFGQVFKVITPETVLTFENDKGGYFVKKVIWHGKNRLVLIRLNGDEKQMTVECLKLICSERQGFLLRNKVRIWWGLNEQQPNIPFAIAGKRR